MLQWLHPIKKIKDCVEIMNEQVEICGQLITQLTFHES